MYYHDFMSIVGTTIIVDTTTNIVVTTMSIVGTTMITEDTTIIIVRTTITKFRRPGQKITYPIAVSSDDQINEGYLPKIKYFGYPMKLIHFHIKKYGINLFPSQSKM